MGKKIGKYILIFVFLWATSTGTLVNALKGDTPQSSPESTPERDVAEYKNEKSESEIVEIEEDKLEKDTLNEGYIVWLEGCQDEKNDVEMESDIRESSTIHKAKSKFNLFLGWVKK